MKIILKLFLTLFALTTFVVLVSLGLARWSFQQGFYDFVDGLEQQRLQRFSEQLKQEFIAAGYSWEPLRGGNMEYLVRKIPRGDRQRFSQRGSGGEGGRPPPPPGMRPQHGNGPPKGSGPLRDNGPPRGDAPPRGKGPPGGTRSHAGDEKGPPTALLDRDGNFVIGDERPEDATSSSQIDLFLGDELIGRLISWTGTQAPSPLQSNFSGQQLYTSLVIGLVCLLLAGLISWIAAQRLLKPVRLVLRGVSTLSKGEYTVKFTENRQDELGQLMDDIAHLSLTLDKNRSAKNRWFADISHELRTPLTVLSGEMELLKAGARPFDQKQLQSFEQEINLLKHLVDDLYDLSLSDVGGLKYNFEKHNLLNCLAIVLDSMEKQAADKQLSLNLKVESEDVWANIDPQRIEQLLRNLCANSIVYTDGPGIIQFTIDKEKVQSQTQEKANLAVKDKEHIIITVEDTKPGVTEADCQLLFDPLYRKDESRTRRASGAGLGLTISKNVVQAHGGKIIASPSKMGGLKIQIQLKALLVE